MPDYNDKIARIAKESIEQLSETEREAVANVIGVSRIDPPLDIEYEIEQALAEEIRIEIDREILNQLRKDFG